MEHGKDKNDVAAGFRVGKHEIQAKTKDLNDKLGFMYTTQLIRLVISKFGVYFRSLVATISD